jgi:hypothetical protein
MESAAVALAILGFAVGMLFRLKILLAILLLLVVASIIFSVAYGFTFLDTALTIMAVQAIFQGCYFLGLVIRFLLTAANRTRPIL